MREKTLPWLMAVSALAAAACLAGLAWTLYDYFREVPPVTLTKPPEAVQEAPAAPAEDDGKFRVLALGDSLTRGYGDPEGKGYAGYLADALKGKAKEEVVLENLGVNGQTSPQLAEMLGQAAVQGQVKAADIILVSIGGNDLFRGGETLATLDLAAVAKIQEEYTKQLQGILGRLRELNPQANLFLIGLYNPFIELKDANVTSKIVRDWNYQAAETAAAYPKTVLVPTFDLFQLKVSDYLYTDQFHPNVQGYKLIAERAAALVTW
ncbi:SGNH/GDSL hydrolase family protein [Paenibacillus mucilaginosus]|uniref:Lysophospholipase L1-like esterase n=1 Tax=Paenibacillus mucilaginosus (strain KNP414) TaxID=1036673 RepID=F8FIW8_PAEMK|nr:SGNH/GDSL hydrolase family protein [Paenibacillus mucilaginosus]AEI46346.1 Lysophospholipase L1-like esterase [Paenibacillus mucilaginosus KNP414]MCG7213540.1 SGNH/GDSL hydrolase family protein [Paenibacillus mucilaginosus]WDM27644.1 SGNH/GDSL hydrolase family protein [Paenibacillus mucilaginosus]